MEPAQRPGDYEHRDRQTYGLACLGKAETALGLQGLGTYPLVQSASTDLARRFANDVDSAGWVLTVGKGFAFGSLVTGSN